MRSPTPKYSFHKWRNDHGGALVEFAIVMPLLLLILFGILEFSIVFHNKSLLTNASREGARSGSAFDYDIDNYPDNTSVIQTVTTYLSNSHLINFGSATPVVTVNHIDSDSDGSLSSGDYRVVKVTYQHRFLTISNIIQLFGGNINTTINLTGETAMLLL